MRLAIHGRTLVAALAILAAGQLASTRTIRGQDPQSRCPLQVKVHSDGSGLFEGIPFVSRLWNGGEAKPACADDVERIGIDFEILPKIGHAECQACPRAAGTAIFVARADETCASGKCDADGKCCAEGKCCVSGKCCANEKCCAVARCCAVECGDKEACLAASEEKSELWEHFAELTAENAAMETMLQAHEEILEAREEMFETVTELMVEKARLEARLEMVEHRDGLLKELVELQAENARLKAQAEVAQQKEELLTTQFATALENEQLKQRVAELERQTGADDKPVLAEKKVKARKNR